MATYEVTIIFNPELEMEVIDGFVGKIKENVVSKEGEIRKCDMWGKKRLAYEIKKYREGNFVYFEFISSPAVIKEIDRKCKLADEIIRYMIIKQTAISNKNPVTVEEISTQVSELSESVKVTEDELTENSDKEG